MDLLFKENNKKKYSWQKVISEPPKSLNKMLTLNPTAAVSFQN